MRFDSVGLFWEELPPPIKEKKVVKEKRQPPIRTWESPDYLPGLNEARQFDVDLFTDPSGQDLYQACLARDALVFDIEVYRNYFLACFRSLQSKRVVYFEMFDGCELNIAKLAWVVRNFKLIGFNSRAFDIPLLQLAIAGATCSQLKDATDKIIHEDVPGWELLKSFNVDEFIGDHIDLIKVAPLQASLKIYGGRLHCKRMWDLPFAPDTNLSADQMTITRWYCLNDLDQTELLYDALRSQIDMRARMGADIDKDLRSLSDAQIAESVISYQLRQAGIVPRRVQIREGEIYQYQPPAFIKFNTPYMQEIYSQILEFDFTVGADGYVKQPAALEALKISIGQSEYQMGMGGLHSCEKQAIHIADDTVRIIDRDVASYYPAIILNCELYPEHLGKQFLEIYRTIVQKRLQAKRCGNKVEADSLKITINGTFGKLGSKWSFLYAPNLLFQVTITGQLSLLMLIEQLESNGIHVISANTDGIVFKVAHSCKELADAIIKQWELATGFETEESEYHALYSRDINNYIAVKINGETKNKGTFANPWAQNNSIFRLHKNPTTIICIEAVEQYLINQTPLLDTIVACTDIWKFVSIRTVKGGAIKDGVYLGKAIRWYYGAASEGEIIYASSGNAVAKTQGAVPLMTLPLTLPADIDYAWYENECLEILKNFGIPLDF